MKFKFLINNKCNTKRKMDGILDPTLIAKLNEKNDAKIDFTLKTKVNVKLDVR